MELFNSELKTPHSDLLTVQKICEYEHPYTYSDSYEADFLTAMKEIILWHTSKSDFYSKLIKKNDFSIDQVRTIDDLSKIPFVFANFFKNYEVKSISDKDISVHLTSSGTTGQKSQMFFDDWTLESAQRMIDYIFNYYGWINLKGESVNYLLFTYEPEGNSNLGTAYTDNFLCQYAPIESVFYSLKFAGEEEHKFDLFGTIEALRKFERDGRPVRIFGFPAFFYFTLSKMKELNIEPLKLNPDSLVFLGGGWKGNQDKAIEKSDLYALATEMLGIPNERLRDGFGSVEHCIPYIECSNHNFHIPVYSHVLIRDVKTLRPVKDGDVGYLNFVSPYITSVAANSVLMGDLASKHSADECPCELNVPFFKIIGRAGVSKNKSCAIKASELLDEFSAGEK